MSMMGAPIPECFTTPGENCLPVQAVVLCDVNGATVTPFVRRYFFDCNSGSLLGFADTDLDGNAYVVSGTVDFCSGGSCPDCVPDAFRQRRDQIAGIGAWVRPAGAYLVTVKCRAVGDVLNPPTITDAAGTITPLFVGDEETWQSPDGTPLSSTFTVITNDASDLITIVWVEVV